MPDTGIGKLISAGCIKTCIVPHIGLNPETQQLMNEGTLGAELVPQSTLVEQINECRDWAGCGRPLDMFVTSGCSGPQSGYVVPHEFRAVEVR